MSASAKARIRRLAPERTSFDDVAYEETVPSGPIIVGVEGSERSLDALALADLLTPLLGGDQVLAFVHSFGRTSGRGAYQQLVREATEERFEAVRGALPSARERQMRLLAGSSPAEALQALAEREAASLLVLGSSHRSGIGRVFPGGTAERLLTCAPAPIAIAPAGYASHYAHLGRIGVALDGTAESGQALEWAARLSQAASAELLVIGIHAPVPAAGFPIDAGIVAGSLAGDLHRQETELVEDAVTRHSRSLDVRGLLLAGDPATALAEESHRLDLLVLGSRGRAPLRAVLLGSVSFALIHAAAVPIVITPRYTAGAEIS